MYYIVYIIDYIKYLYLCYYIFIYDILNTSRSAQTERNLLQVATKYVFILEKQALKESMSGMSLV